MGIYGWDRKQKSKAKEVIGSLVFELDCEEDPQKSFTEAVKIIDHLKNEYGIPKKQVEIYFSGGKSPHILVPPETFGAEPMERDKLVMKYKAIAEEVKQKLDLKTLDPVPLGRGMLRMPGYKHEVSGLFKIPLSYEELKKGYDFARKLAEKPRSHKFADPKVADKAREAFEKVRVKRSARAKPNPLMEPNENWQKSRCLQKILADTRPGYDKMLAAAQAVKANFRGDMDQSTDFLIKNAAWATSPEKVRKHLAGLKFFPKKERFKEYCKDCKRCKLYPKLINEYNKEKKGARAMVAEYLLEEREILTHRKTEDIYVYRNGVYHLGGEQVVKELCQETMGPLTTTYDIKEITETIKRCTFISEEEFEKPKTKISVLNGILDLKKMKKEPHTPDFITRIQLPVEYDPDATCPKFMKFLSEIVPSGEIPVIQEFVGYCLWKETPFHRYFVLIGEGRNGKSTLLDSIMALLGEKNVCNVSLQDITNSRFGAARLVGKLANIYPDLGTRALNSTGKLKSMVAGDRMHVEKKFKDGMDYTNYAKLIFSANRLPKSPDDSTAFWARFIIVNFPHYFGEEKAKKNLVQELTTPEELSGMLNWALAGLGRLMKQGKFSYSTSQEEVRTQYLRLSDAIAAFTEERMEYDGKTELEKEEVYSAYVSYCKGYDLVPKDKNIFARELPKHANGILAGQKHGGERVWRGWRWKNEEEQNDKPKQNTL